MNGRWRWWSLAVALAAMVWAVGASDTQASVREFATLIGPAVLLLVIWMIGSPSRTGAVILLGWIWVGTASYVFRYRPSWPLSDFDQVPGDVIAVVIVAATLGTQHLRRSGRRPDGGRRHRWIRPAAISVLVLLGGMWWLVALFTGTRGGPPDGAATVLDLPDDGLVLVTPTTWGGGPADWSCSATGEYCHDSVRVAADDGAATDVVLDRLNRHLNAMGWKLPRQDHVSKGLIFTVPMAVHIFPGPAGTVDVIVYWGSDGTP